MHTVVPPAPSRKSLALSAVLFAVPLALAQRVMLFLCVQVRAVDVLHAGRFTFSNSCTVASS